MSKENQKVPFQMIFDVNKKYLRRKFRCVVGAHKIGSEHLESHSSVVQPMRIRLSLTMDHKHKLKIMCGVVSNEFPNAPANDKINAMDCEEFGERQRCEVETIKSLCEKSAASRSFALYLGNFIRP